jgi:hypothetical protein
MIRNKTNTLKQIRMHKVIKHISINLTVFLLLSFVLCDTSMAQQPPTEFPVLSGSYFGQKLPGYIPEVLLPGIISSNKLWKHSPLAISPDGTEAYWSVANPFALYYMKLENKQWTKPETAPFTKGLECSSPVFSPDGKKLYFASQVIEHREDGKSARNPIWLWYVDQEQSGWSQPKAVDSIINNGKTDYQISLTNDGTIYFSAARDGGKGQSDIYYSRFVNGKYSTPVNAGDSINTELGETRVFVSPDESFMMFTRMVPVKRIMRIYSDFYISYKRFDGSWTKAEEIGDMMGEKTSSSWINVSPDGKYIFHTSLYPGRTTNIYWSAASSVIDYLMPYECIVSNSIEETINKYKEIKNSDPQNWKIQESRFVSLGYRFLNSDRITEAVNIFKINTALYPQSWNTYDCLGEAYAKAGNKDLAIENYEKSLKLNPTSKSSIEAIKQLKGDK